MQILSHYTENKCQQNDVACTTFDSPVCNFQQVSRYVSYLKYRDTYSIVRVPYRYDPTPTPTCVT